MSVVAITMPSGLPRFRMRVVLDGREYGLAFRWSQREERWFLDLFDANGSLLLAGIKVVANYPLLARFRGSSSIPANELVAVDLRSPARDPGLEELGTDVQLCYGPLDEMPGLFTTEAS